MVRNCGPRPGLGQSDSNEMFRVNEIRVNSNIRQSVNLDSAAVAAPMDSKLPFSFEHD